MPPDDLEAQRWLRELFRTLGEQHPALKTAEHQERLARALSAEETLAIGMQAELATYQYARTDTTPPVHMREYLLVRALQHIAEGHVKMRATRAFAAQALTMWQEQRLKEDTSYGEDR